MRHLLLLLCGASLLPAAPLKTARLLAEGKGPVRIVCIGDSITGVYYHSGGLRAYPEMLQIALQKVHPRTQTIVRNAGISGDTTLGALKRLERDVLVHRPHLVTVMFGMNDLVRMPLDDFRKNLLNVVARCRQADAEVLLCTQNSVVESAQRPRARLAEFTRVIREIAQVEFLPLADCYAAFEAVRSRDPLEWNLLLSDSIHPNMDGHKLFAETIARTITDRKVSLRDVGPPEPALRHTLECLNSGKPLKVLAMPPYDALVGPAIQRLRPDAIVNITRWPVEGQTLAQLEESARKVRSLTQDLVIIAVPGTLPVQEPEQFHKSYSWIMNWSLSFGPQQWDVIVAAPSASKFTLTAEEQAHEQLAGRLIKAQDLHMIARRAGDVTSPADLLSRWLSQHLSPARN